MKNNTEEAAKQTAIQRAKKEFERLKENATIRDQIYLDGVLAVLDTCEKEALADASKEEPKGLEELRYPKDIIQLIWLGKKSACNKDCKCHAECEEADNFISKLRVANQIPNNEELKQKLEFIKQEYINCVNDIDEILDTVQECIEIVSGVSNTSESPTFLEVMKENTELKIRLQLIKIEKKKKKKGR